MEVIDNFLSEKEFIDIKKTIMHRSFPLYFADYINDNDKSNYYFLHFFYDEFVPMSPFMNILEPLIKKLKIKALLRAKVNCFPRTEKLIIYEPHRDYDFSHNGAILYLNNCDGGTYVGDKFFQSKENRVLLFDSSQKHSSTNCTDQKCRYNININFF
tara:strand:+ start:204 stop:674 length:471 start_codon:yes stop_codon:yes gene_type:complete